MLVIAGFYREEVQKTFDALRKTIWGERHMKVATAKSGWIESDARMRVGDGRL